MLNREAFHGEDAILDCIKEIPELAVDIFQFTPFNGILLTLNRPQFY